LHFIRKFIMTSFQLIILLLVRSHQAEIIVCVFYLAPSDRGTVAFHFKIEETSLIQHS